MMEDLNLVSDCVEAVYSQIEEKKEMLPIEKIKKIVDSKTKPEDFDILKNIAKGGYGEVFLVKKDKIYAMKRVPKEIVLRQPHTTLFMAEKEVLIDSIGSEWLVSAEMTLQDEQYLYYLMDFVPGGDFMGLLSKEDVLEEEWVRFYVVEIVAALDELHSLGWIHRDLKPDNILIGMDGHIRLADFGSCIKMVEGKARSSITVGTPDYVSPDILTSKSAENEYTENLDFWTLGVIIYEMVYGTTPFYSSTLVETYRKINEVNFIFPFKIGEQLKDLIQKLICKKEERLNIEQIKAHSFFEGVDWSNVKGMTPPFIPEIHGEYDTSNFVDTNFEVESKCITTKGEYLPFVGFSHDPKIVQFFKNLVGGIENTTPPPVVLNTPHDEEIEKKKSVLLEMENMIQAHNKEVKSKQDELKRIMMCVVNEKEELEEIQNEIKEKTSILKKMLIELNDRKEIYKDADMNKEGIKFENHSNTKMIVEKLNDHITSVFDNYKICSEEVDGLRNDADMLFETTYLLLDALKLSEGRKEELQGKVKILEVENGKMKKIGIDSLKKQVRILTTEIKEYEQKLNQEILLRKQLEVELKSLKNDRQKIDHAPTFKQEFPCKVLNGERFVSSTIKIIDDQFYLNEIAYSFGNVFLHELKNNELHHQSYKNRSLSLKLIFIKECIKSVSSVGRRSIKSLEEDLKIEESMVKGLETMMSLLNGKQLEEAEKQLAGSLKKISQLKCEIDMARKSTITEEVPEDPVKLYEFNNHLFAIKTFPPGVLCEHCNEVLYGIQDQGFECRDCKMVVHRSCYVLGDVSCEMYSAFKTGETYYVMMRSIEDKERLLSVYKKF